MHAKKWDKKARARARTRRRELQRDMHGRGLSKAMRLARAVVKL